MRFPVTPPFAGIKPCARGLKLAHRGYTFLICISKEAIVQVSKWGNSLAVRIPADVARALGLKEGDDVELCALDDRQVAIVTDRQRRAAALEQLKKFRGSLPPDFKFDREEANAR
jgi:antitoxin MazE